MRHLLWTLLTLVFPLCALAVTIEFPEEELAKESVLPVFEGGTTAVKSRRVITKNKLELGLMAGFIFNEPFFSPYAGGLRLGYHFTEFSSMQISAFMRDAKKSSDAEEIDSKTTTRIGFDAVPIPKYFLLADYQMTPYYGKISLTKDTVLNMNLYGILGAGVIDLGGKVSWIANLGLGQNLFFTPRLAFRSDLRFLFYQGLNVLSNPDSRTSPSALPASTFASQFNISPSLTLGVTFLL